MKIPECSGLVERNRFYQIYMPSYCDSNGDGYSDFRGMISKLDYLQSLGIKGIWLTPFLRSPKVDNGYDVASYLEIDTTYGDMDDFGMFGRGASKRHQSDHRYGL